jgi:hypothetical protein
VDLLLVGLLLVHFLLLADFLHLLLLLLLLKLCMKSLNFMMTTFTPTQILHVVKQIYSWVTIRVGTIL